MASLENKKIKDTYEGLLKTDDNAAIDGAVEITDGAGNGTGVTISNDGQVTATGTVSFGSLKDTGEDITVTKFVDEADGIGNNDNDTSVPTSAAVKDYVDTNVTAQDLDFQGDSGTGAVDLDSQSLDIAGGTGIDTSAVDQTLTVNIDSTVATLSDTQTLTNKTVDADNNTVSNLEVDNLKSGVLDTDLTSVSASDDTLASAKAIKTYVDSNITAQDLDITDGTTTSAVDLDSQTLTIEGTTNEVEVSLTDQTFTVGLPTSITTNVTGNLTGNVTGNVTGNLTGNVTGDVTGNADTASALETARTISLSGDVAGSVSFDGSANADITATIQANSVALGTDTTGDYVSGLGTGTGVTIGSNTGEGSSPTISVDYGSTANTAVQGNTSLTIQGTANEIEVIGGGVTLGSGGTVTVGLPDDVSLGGSLTIAQNLTVNGTTTTVNTDTLSVEDPLIELARDNSENSVDVGLYGKYSLDSGVTTKYSGLFKDASDSDKFKLFKGLEVEPTSTVDTAGTGYTKGDLVINDLDAVTISGTISTAAQTNITSVGTLSSLTVGGDLTVDTNTLYVDSSNNRVGLGTSSPSEKLDVSGTIQSSANEGKLVLNSTATNGKEYQFISIDSGNLGLFDGTAYRLWVSGSGDIGIGTSSPSSLLEVFDSNGIGLRFGDIASTPSSQTAGYIGMSTSAYSGNNGDLVLIPRTSSASNILLMEGNVGIGTSSPTAKTDIRTSASSGGTSSPTFRAFGYDTDSYFEVNNNANNSANIKLTRSDAATMFSIDGHSGTTFFNGNVGIGTSSPDRNLTIKNSSDGVNGLSFQSYAANTEVGYIRYEQTNDILDIVNTSSFGGSGIKFSTNNTERLRIDSNGAVGLGLTNAYNYGFNGVGLAVKNSSGYGIVTIASDTDKTGYLAFADGTSGDERYRGTVEYTHSSDTMNFRTSGSARMTIDSEGEVSVYNDFTIDNGSPEMYFKTGGSHYRWMVAAQENVDAALEITPSTTLGGGTYSTPVAVFKATGQVGIGTSSPQQLLSIQDTSDNAYLHCVAGTSNLGGVWVGDSDSDYVGGFLYDNGQNASYFYTNGSERMQITSGGDVGIGTSSITDSRVQIKGAGNATNTYVDGLKVTSNNETVYTQYNWNGINNNTGLLFAVGGTERMQITSGGDVYIGTQTTSVSNGAFTFRSIGATNTFLDIGHKTGSTSGASFVVFRYNGTQIGDISQSGTTAVAYNTTSDYRLKENVVDMTGALDRVDQLKPSRFNFISDEDTTVDGFLAHEVQDIVPEAVTGEKDATEEYEVSPEVLDDEGNVVEEAVMGTRDVYQGIDQSKLVPLLVGAIKELRAEVNSLKAQINN